MMAAVGLTYMTPVGLNMVDVDIARALSIYG